MSAGVSGNKGRRVGALLRARLGGEDRGTSLPIAPLLMHAMVASVLCVLVRTELPPFAYATYALWYALGVEGPGQTAAPAGE